MNSLSLFNSLHLHTSVPYPPSFIKFCLFVCSFVSFLHLFVCLFILTVCSLRSFDRSYVHSFVRSFVRSFVHTFIQLLLFHRSFAPSLRRVQLVEYSFGRSSFDHSFFIPGKFDGMIDFIPSWTWWDEIEIRTQHWSRITFGIVCVNSLYCRAAILLHLYKILYTNIVWLHSISLPGMQILYSGVMHNIEAHAYVVRKTLPKTNPGARFAENHSLRDRFTKQNSGRVLFSGLLSEQFTKQLPYFVKNPEFIFAKQSVYLYKIYYKALIQIHTQQEYSISNRILAVLVD